MACNVGGVDRLLRALVGLGLIIPLATAIFGGCPPYALLGISTCRTRSPDLGRPS